MYLQKSFKLFENNEDIIENNQKYDTLIDILNSYVFDDLDIVKQTDESFESSFFRGEEVLHKFWCFAVPNSVAEVPTDKKIRSIYVYNILLKECPEFEAKLNAIVPLVQSYLDMDLGYEAEEYNDWYWDYIIKLVELK